MTQGTRTYASWLRLGEMLDWWVTPWSLVSKVVLLHGLVRRCRCSQKRERQRLLHRWQVTDCWLLCTKSRFQCRDRVVLHKKHPSLCLDSQCYNTSNKRMDVIYTIVIRLSKERCPIHNGYGRKRHEIKSQVSWMTLLYFFNCLCNLSLWQSTLLWQSFQWLLILASHPYWTEMPFSIALILVSWYMPQYQ